MAIFKSTDLDECAQGISGCNQICTNTIGSYVCSCYYGYQIAQNNRTCTGKNTLINHAEQYPYAIFQSVDVNECALDISGCGQICTNTNGSYTCSCDLGYKISLNNRTCVGKSLTETNQLR